MMQTAQSTSADEPAPYGEPIPVMNGTTPIEPETPENVKEKRIAVVETFGPTIQGEGPLAGVKTMFIRFGGCDYRCTKCDSLHAVIPAAVKVNSEYLTAEEIASRIIPEAKKTGTEWVVLSGGNPCMWDLTELITELQIKGLRVQVETQGTLAPSWLEFCDLVVVSPKSPGMGEKFEADKFDRFLYACYDRPVALKIVVFSMQDIEFALEVRDIAGERIRNNMLYMSLGNESPPKLGADQKLIMNEPDGGLVVQLLNNYRISVEDMLIDPRITHWKFLPQLHVLIWGNEAEK
jgi:7-carboxy-7-deazaguanine synthase